MKPACVLLLGREGADHVRLEIAAATVDRIAPEWRTHAAIVTIAAGPFNGSFATRLRDTDLAHFISALRDMSARLAGAAALEAVDGTLRLNLAGNGVGRIAVSGAGADDPAAEHRLHFGFAIDQSYLPPLLAAARALEGA